MAAFIDRQLRGRARARVLAHLLWCDDCLTLVLDVVAALRAPGQARPDRSSVSTRASRVFVASARLADDRAPDGPADAMSGRAHARNGRTCSVCIGHGAHGQGNPKTAKFSVK